MQCISILGKRYTILDTWMMRIVLGLGGNVGDVRSAFDRAVVALGEYSGVEIRDRSSLWRTIAVGPEQPPYLNAAILVALETSPRDLLRVCQGIEAAAGRDRRAEIRWGPRTLDLDLLIADTVAPFSNCPIPLGGPGLRSGTCGRGGAGMAPPSRRPNSGQAGGESAIGNRKCR